MYPRVDAATDAGMLSDGLYPCENGKVARVRMLCRHSRPPRAGVCLCVAAWRVMIVWFKRS